MKYEPTSKGTVLSIVITTHNNYNYLKILLESVFKYQYFKQNKIIVHAENCTDETNDYLNDLLKKQKIYKAIIDINQDPKGIAGGINYAISFVDTDYFILLHSDMVVSKNFDLILYDYIKESKKTVVSAYRAEPDIWGHNTSYPGTLTIPIDLCGEYYHNFDKNIWNAWSKEFISLNSEILSTKIQGAGGYIMRKEEWDDIGGCDERFKPACYDDVDLELRLIIENYNLIMTNKTIIYHFGARGSHFPDDNLQKKSQRQIDSENSGIKKFIDKWGDYPKRDFGYNYIPTPKMIQRYKETIKPQK